MFNIRDYLQKFQSLTSREGEVRDAVVAVISSQCGADLDREHVRFYNKCVFITAHPLVKNEIHLQKKRILALLNERTSSVVRDIR